MQLPVLMQLGFLFGWFVFAHLGLFLCRQTLQMELLGEGCHTFYTSVAEVKRNCTCADTQAGDADFNQPWQSQGD